MKKTLAAALIGIMAMQLPAEAAITLTDASSGTVRISGSADSGQRITLLVLNPGYTSADALEKTEQSVQYLGSMTAADNAYSFDVDINTESGGLYTVYVTADDVMSEAEEFEFYPIAVKESVIEKLNNTSSPDEALLDEVIKIFSLAKHPLYINADKKTITTVIKSVKDLQEGKKFAVDTDKFYKLLNQCLVLAGYNDRLSDCVFTDGFINSADILDLTVTAAYTDYLKSLNVSGRNAFNSDLLNNTYYSADDFLREFEKLTAYHVIKNYSMRGYGHIPSYFKKYKSIYENAGFNFSRSASDAVYSKLLSSSAKNLTELAVFYNSLLSKPSAGGGGGGSSSGGTKSGKVTAQPISDTGKDYYGSAEKNVFSDVSDTHWAYEYIMPLYDKGIISGYGNNTFEPSSPVTRAEFTKLICGALKLEKAQKPLPFKDVDGTWCAEYVAAAYENGIINGVSDDEFGADAPITREQAAAIIYRALPYSEENTADNPFADDDGISDYAKAAVYALRGSGIISGRDGNMFEPHGKLTRAEAAKMIFGMINSGGSE